MRLTQVNLAVPECNCRPHPYAPNKPPLNFFTNSTAMALDTVRDVMRFGPGNIQTTVGQVAPREVLTR